MTTNPPQCTLCHKASPQTPTTKTNTSLLSLLPQAMFTLPWNSKNSRKTQQILLIKSKLITHKVPISDRFGVLASQWSLQSGICHGLYHRNSMTKQIYILSLLRWAWVEKASRNQVNGLSGREVIVGSVGSGASKLTNLSGVQLLLYNHLHCICEAGIFWVQVSDNWWRQGSSLGLTQHSLTSLGNSSPWNAGTGYDWKCEVLDFL